MEPPTDIAILFFSSAAFSAIAVALAANASKPAAQIVKNGFIISSLRRID